MPDAAPVAVPDQPQAPAAAPPPAAPDTPPPPTAGEKAKAAAERARQQASLRREREQQASVERARLAAENDRLTRESRERAEREERWRQDKSAAMRELGIDARTVSQQALLDGTPEGRYAALEARLAEESAARQKLETSLQEREQQANVQRVRADFLRIAGDATRFPTVANADPQFVLTVAQKIATDALERTGKYYSHEEVLDYLERKWVGKGSKAPAAAEKTEEPASPTTLTNSQAGHRTDLPLEFSKMSDQQQAKVFANALRGKKATK